MKIVCSSLWLTLALVLLAWIPVSVCQQCSRRPDLVYQEKGDATVTVLLDLTYGAKCNKTSASSSQSMHGLLQTLQTLNTIQFLGSFKIGMRVYDTCGQESMALQAVLDTALELNLTYKYSCRSTAHLGFMYQQRSYPALTPLTTVMNAPVTDISQWQGSSPMSAVVDLLSSLKWSSVAVVSQSKQILANFYRKASDKDICIVAQSVLPPNNKAKETTVRVVRRSKRSGSKVYVLIGSAEFLVNLIPYFQSNGTASSTKYVLIATDSWNANLTQEISSSVQEALIIRPQRILSDDNISARVFYSLMKQYKNHLNVVCQGRIKDCEFEQHHLKKLALGDDDLNILKLSKDMAIYNEQFPVSYILSNGTSVDIGSIYEDKFIPLNNSAVIQEIEPVECDDCLCTNVDAVSNFVFQLRTELLLMVAGGISSLGILLTIILLILMLKTQCSSNCADRSGNFIFPMMFTILLLFLVSFLYILVPSSILCLARAISLSAVYTIFLGHLFSVTTTTFVVHPTTRGAGHILQILLFFFIISVQVPVLTYETLFRDETLMTNKILTDYGPKIECTLDDVLSFKLFLYPMTLLAMQMIASIAILVNHWKVKAIKIKLAVGSLLVVAVNVAWGVCYFQLDKQWRDLVILSGLQGNGFVMMLAVVIPKIVFNVNNNSQSFRAKSINHLANPENGSDDPDRNLHPGHPARTQHIYAIPSHEADRNSIIESEREFNTAM